MEESFTTQNLAVCAFRMKEIFWVVSLFVSLLITGCGSNENAPTSQPIGSDIIQKYNFHIEGEPTTIITTLPQQFNDANWGLKELICEQAGYSLTPYAGESITLIKFNITGRDEMFPNEPLYLWVVAKDQTSICGYLTVREQSGLIPGVFAVNDPIIK